MKLMSLPIFIIPHENVIVNSEPGSADLWENSHHAVTLHICKAFRIKEMNQNKMSEWYLWVNSHREWLRGYGWIAPPAQVAEGLCGLH